MTYPINEVADSLVHLQVCTAREEVVDGEPADNQPLTPCEVWTYWLAYQGATAIKTT